MRVNVHYLVFISLFILVSARYLPDQIISNNSTSVEEIQHAICKIATKDIQASANATITRQLKGVCTSKELNHRLDLLEKRLFHELNRIKYALGIIETNAPTPDDNEVQLKALEKNELTSNLFDYDYLNTVESVKTEGVYNPQTITTNIKQTTTKPIWINPTKEPEVPNLSYTTKTTTPSSNIKQNQISYKRDLEAAKFNATIQQTKSSKNFLYFWKIYDIEEIVAHTDDQLHSPVFYLLGHPLQIKFYPRHLGTQYTAVELSSVDGFIFKHRFTILNQNNEQEDLTSQILGTNAALFRISLQKLSNGNFTIDGSLMVKLSVILNV